MVLLRKLSRRDSLKCNTDRDDRGWTPLHVAARMGNLDEVRTFHQMKIHLQKCVCLNFLVNLTRCWRSA